MRSRRAWSGKAVPLRMVAFVAALPVLAWAGVAAANLGTATVTCNGTANGNTGIFTIGIPANSPSFGGDAFAGPSGLTVTSLTASGFSGSFSNGGPGGAGELLFSSPENGAGASTVIFDAGLSGPFTSGVFTVFPTNFPPSDYYNGVPCTLLGGSTAPATSSGEASNVFAPPTLFPFDPIRMEWDPTVSLPGPGSVSFMQIPSPSSAPLLIKNGQGTATKAGVFTLHLKPTTAGKQNLKKTGQLKVKLKLTFTPTGGTSASKTFSATLRSK